MLSIKQIKFAETSDRVDMYPDPESGLVFYAHHTDKGVFVICRIPPAGNAVTDNSFYISYRMLAVLNSREWNRGMSVGGYRSLLEDCGQVFAAQNYEPKISKDSPGHIFSNMFLNSRRDDEGCPLAGTQWRRNDHRNEVIELIKRSKKAKPVLILVKDLTTGRTRLVNLKAFNDEYIPW